MYWGAFNGWEEFDNFENNTFGFGDNERMSERKDNNSGSGDECIFESDAYKDCAPYIKAMVEFSYGMMSELGLQGTEYEFNCGTFTSAAFEQGRMLGAAYWHDIQYSGIQELVDRYSEPYNRAILALTMGGKWVWAPSFQMMKFDDFIKSIENLRPDRQMTNDDIVNELISKLENVADEMGVQMKVTKVHIGNDLEEKKEENLANFDIAGLDNYLNNILKSGKIDEDEREIPPSA